MKSAKVFVNRSTEMIKSKKVQKESSNISVWEMYPVIKVQCNHTFPNFDYVKVSYLLAFTNPFHWLFHLLHLLINYIKQSWNF